MHLILYSKPGCHLCEGLQEKLQQITSLAIALEIRDITTRDDWFTAYQYEIPMLYHAWDDTGGTILPIARPSPRVTVAQLEQMLLKYDQRSTK